jgi:hypothetical protein
MKPLPLSDCIGQTRRQTTSGHIHGLARLRGQQRAGCYPMTVIDAGARMCAD